MTRKIRFSEIESSVLARPGIYEIHTDSGIPLKVGIGGNIQKRLLQHRASRQARLKLKAGGQCSNPSDMQSKESILAKHLYYDTTVTTDFDLTLEAGRTAFLEEKCHIIFQTTSSRAEARELERKKENGGCFRYIGRVCKR